MLVDDDPLMHQLYRPHVEKAGYSVLSVSTGEEALEVAERETPQLIIMDVRLPGLDGLTTLREIRKHDNTRSIPAIVITAVNEYEICRREVKDIGGATFLPKPFGPGQLIAEIKRLVGESAGRV